MRDTPVDLFIRGLVYIANSLGVAAAAPLPPSPPTRSVASFTAHMGVTCRFPVASRRLDEMPP